MKRKIKRILSKLKNLLQLSKPFTPPATAINTIPSQTILAPRSSRRRPAVKDNKSQLNAPLEKLPPEVRRQLLSILELEELNTLVHASPVFYQQYLLDRKYLLCKSLEKTLCGVTTDAYAVYQSGLADFANTRTREGVSQFLKVYQDQCSSAQYSILTESLTEDAAVGMATFVFSIIKPLVGHYTRWALANLANETGNSHSHEPLSKTEEIRLMRALYRFQLCCNLFGNNHYRTSWQIDLRFMSHDILNIFFCIFEPWEVEEIACIHTFVKEKYDQIFRDIYWDVHKENPKFKGQRPITPEGAFDLDESWTRDMLLIGTVSHGLELLHTTLFKIRDHAHLVSTMQEHIKWPAGYFLEDEALGETAQYWRRQERLSDRDHKQERRDPLPFQGDRGSRPPLAWTLIWRETYSNLYGSYIQDDIRRWGYVMWDAARLQNTGAKEVLARQWEAKWRDSDPRDNV
ncbi:hypothetical protein F4680DRAFT_466195 [Xylaria scruposa]|nr:hypothetical protein F4680DRAFT_466195 [Xylaria scruposa]